MRVLVTGNRGYIGAVLTSYLKERSYEVVGLDVDYYNGCEITDIVPPDKQIIKDIREVTKKDLSGIDYIIHLAALSNDPLGELSPSLTEEINLGGTIRLAEAAKEIGIKRFVYASSQSMYGISETDDELDEEDSDKNPVTSYAKTKWDAELFLRSIADSDFLVACFRPSTVFGFSPKLRCDIVYNYFVACAYTTGKIEVKSDGTPWRPVIHVEDVCSAFLAGIEAPRDLVAGQSFNVGILGGNYTVRELAEAAIQVVPSSEVIFTGEHSDQRTYRVSFKKINTVLNEYFKPKWDLLSGGQDMIANFKSIGFNEKIFRGSKCNRLSHLHDLIETGKLSRQLTRI